jgi:hypothetical protein
MTLRTRNVERTAKIIEAATQLFAHQGYEYQLWPGFEGHATSFTSGTGGITPNGLSFGVSYAVIR